MSIKALDAQTPKAEAPEPEAMQPRRAMDEKVRSMDPMREDGVISKVMDDEPFAYQVQTPSGSYIASGLELMEPGEDYEDDDMPVGRLVAALFDGAATVGAVKAAIADMQKAHTDELADAHAAAQVADDAATQWRAQAVTLALQAGGVRADLADIAADKVDVSEPSALTEAVASLKADRPSLFAEAKAQQPDVKVVEKVVEKVVSAPSAKLPNTAKGDEMAQPSAVIPEPAIKPSKNLPLGRSLAPRTR